MPLSIATSIHREQHAQRSAKLSFAFGFKSYTKKAMDE
jgi:hypothetical protein